MRGGSLWLLLSATSLYALVGATCADEDEPLPTETPTQIYTLAPTQPLTPTLTPAPQLEIEYGEADWVYWLGDSLESLMSMGEPISGRVMGVALPYNPLPGFDGVAPDWGTPPPEANPLKNMTPTQEEINRPHARPYTIWSVEIVDPGSTHYQPGDVISVAKLGGDWEGKRIETRGDPFLENGHSYIWLISPSVDVSEDIDGEGFWVGAFAEFDIDDGIVRATDPMWNDMPAVKELVGLPPDSALEKLVAAKSRSLSPTLAQ